MSTNAWIYVRFSTLEQAKGHSLERQLEGARRYVAQMGWDHSPEREMVDQGLSAFHGTNRARGSALYDFEERVRSGEFEDGAVLVVESLDRLTRQGHEETADLVRFLTRSGVSVATFQDNQIYRAGERLDLGQIITIIVKGELNREEVEKRQGRIKDQWGKRIEGIVSGEHVSVTGFAPSWIAIDPTTKKMSLIPERVQVLNQIYDWYIEGRGAHWIVKHLNETGVESWALKGKKADGWGSSSLARLLTNRAVIGEYEPMSRSRAVRRIESKGIIIPDYYPAAISVDKFNKALAVRKGREKTGGKFISNNSNLLVGIVKCGECGAAANRIYSSRKGDTRKYKRTKGEVAEYVIQTDSSYVKCRNWVRRHGCTNKHAVRYEVILESVMDYFFDDAAETVSKPDHRLQTANEVVAKAEYEVESKKKQIDNLLSMMLIKPLDTLVNKMSDLEDEMKLLKTALQGAVEQRDVIAGAGGSQEAVDEIRALREVLESGEGEELFVARVRTNTAFKNIMDRIEIYDIGNMYGVGFSVFFKNGDVLEFDRLGNRQGGTDGYYDD